MLNLNIERIKSVPFLGILADKGSNLTLMGHLHSKSSERSESSTIFFPIYGPDHYVGSVPKFSSNCRNSITRPTNLSVRWAIIFKVSYLNKCPFMYWLWGKFHPKKVELDCVFFQNFMGNKNIHERRDSREEKEKTEEHQGTRALYQLARPN